MNKMSFDRPSQLHNYKDWVVTKIPSKNKNSVIDYRLDIKISSMDRKKFNLYNYRFYGDSAAPYFHDKTYKAENFLPNFLVRSLSSKVNSLTAQPLSEASTLANIVHWIEWRSGNQKTYLKESLQLPSSEISPQLFERVLEDYTQEIGFESIRTGDFLVIYGTDDIDQIQMPVASYVYIGNGIVLESKKLKKQNFSKFVYLKDIQTHFTSRLMDYRLRSFKVLAKKPLYLSEFIKGTKQPDLNLDHQASKATAEIL